MKSCLSPDLEELMTMDDRAIVIFGGSGVDECPIFDDVEWKSIDTGYKEKRVLDKAEELQIEFPEGLGVGIVEYQQIGNVFFIPRHGKEHRYGPSVTQYKANILAGEMLVRDFLPEENIDNAVFLATSAVGSLNSGVTDKLGSAFRRYMPKSVVNVVEKVASKFGVQIPFDVQVYDLVVPDDIKDESGKFDSLFGMGMVMHINPRPLMDRGLRNILSIEAKFGNYFNAVHEKGVCAIIPGDRFSTDAEGDVRKQYGDIVGMTIIEAFYALELGRRYAAATFVVDLDRDASHEHGTLQVMQDLSKAERVPTYMTRVMGAALQYAGSAGRTDHLNGAIIPSNIDAIGIPKLKEIAVELVKKYC
jgi:purine nucleoside phosphorylase